MYEIHIDNNGNGVEDITFQFRFKNNLADITLPIGGKNVSIPLVQAGAISASSNAALNLKETYQIDVVRGDRRSGQRQAVTVPEACGIWSSRSTSSARKLSARLQATRPTAQSIQTITIPGCTTPGRCSSANARIRSWSPWASVRPAEPEPAGGSGGVDDLADKNVTSIVLEVAAACLTAGGDPVIGAWTTASLRGASGERQPPSGHSVGAKEGGAWVQVSRLGMPLVNEVVIGLKDKDKFNSSKPKDDGQFADYVTNPTFPALAEILFSSAGVRAPTKFPRQDLVTAFLTGVPGLNKPATVSASEMLRLNTSIAVRPKGTQNPLGVLAADNAGFPNGRRPGDDIVDITVRVAMGVLCTLNMPSAFGCVAADAPSGALAYTDDGTTISDAMFGATFRVSGDTPSRWAVKETR